MKINKLSEPYNKGNDWYIKMADGWEMRFVSYEEAWEYYREYLKNVYWGTKTYDKLGVR